MRQGFQNLKRKGREAGLHLRVSVSGFRAVELKASGLQGFRALTVVVLWGFSGSGLDPEL